MVEVGEGVEVVLQVEVLVQVGAGVEEVESLQSMKCLQVGQQMKEGWSQQTQTSAAVEHWRAPAGGAAEMLLPFL